ncbi:MAG: hypothetical protein WD981_02275 [Gaiellaceae bacterium]
MADWNAVLDAAAEELAKIKRLYQEGLSKKTLPPRLPVVVKNILENQRSALDYVAHDLTAKFGSATAKTKVYFPFAPESPKFEASIDRVMPGVRRARPDLAATIERHQPYNRECLKQLQELVNPNKHAGLSPQTRTKTREVTITDRSGGRASISGDVRIGPVGPAGEQGVAFGPGGAISLGEGGAISFGPGGVSVQGAPIDPATQRPSRGAPVRVTETVWVDWVFEGTSLSVIETLRSIQDCVTAAITEILDAA